MFSLCIVVQFQGILKKVKKILDYHYGQFTPEHLNNMRKGILLFNQQKYWECHEEFEHYWLEALGDNARNVYWAIIQIAASLIHYRDGKIVGAKGLINKAKEKIRRCEKLNVETEILYQYLSWQELKDMVLNIPNEPVLDDFKKLFEFRFHDPSTWGN